MYFFNDKKPTEFDPNHCSFNIFTPNEDEFVSDETMFEPQQALFPDVNILSSLSENDVEGNEMDIVNFEENILDDEEIKIFLSQFTEGENNSNNIQQQQSYSPANSHNYFQPSPKNSPEKRIQPADGQENREENEKPGVTTRAKKYTYNKL